MVALGLTGATGCTVEESKTNLRPEGPPEVLQVMVIEDVDDGMGTITPTLNLAYGKHIDACDQLARPDGSDPADIGPFCYDVGDGTVATATLAGQKIRIVFDELLRGTSVEHFSCACSAGTGTDPCGPGGVTAAANPEDCPGGSVPDAAGKWLDVEANGVPDNALLLPDVVTLSCGGMDIVINDDNSFYNPSGNQLVPVAAGLAEGLGPSLVLTPDALPADVDCTITLSGIVDKDGETATMPAGFTFHTAAM